GDYARALEECQKGIDQAPENAHGYMTRGWIHAMRQNRNAAHSDMQRALELAAEDSQVQRFCCSAYCWLTDYAVALGYGRHAVELNRGASDAYVWLGHSYLLSGDLAAALDSYRQAIYLQTDRYFLKNSLREFRNLIESRSVAWETVRQFVDIFEQALV